MLAYNPVINSLLVGETKCQKDSNAACDKYGGYIPGQCDQATDSCWCVDRLGREIPRTRVGYSKGKPKCDVTGTYTLC